MAVSQGQQAGREEAGVIRIEEPRRKFLSERPQLGCLATVPCSSLRRPLGSWGLLSAPTYSFSPLKLPFICFLTQFHLVRNAPRSVEYRSRQPGYILLWVMEYLREFCSGFKSHSQHMSSWASFLTSRWFSFSIYKPGGIIVPTLIEAMWGLSVDG